MWNNREKSYEISYFISYLCENPTNLWKKYYNKIVHEMR